MYVEGVGVAVGLWRDWEREVTDREPVTVLPDSVWPEGVGDHVAVGGDGVGDVLGDEMWEPDADIERVPVMEWVGLQRKVKESVLVKD